MGNTCCHSITCTTQPTPIKTIQINTITVKSLTTTTTQQQHQQHTGKVSPAVHLGLNSVSIKSKSTRSKALFDEYLSQTSRRNSVHTVTSTPTQQSHHQSRRATHTAFAVSSHDGQHTTTGVTVEHDIDIKQRSSNLRGSIRNLPGASHKLLSQPSSGLNTERLIHSIGEHGAGLHSLSQFRLNMSTASSFVDTATLSTPAADSTIQPVPRRKSLRNTRIHYTPHSHTQQPIDELKPHGTGDNTSRRPSLSLVLPAASRLQARQSNNFTSYLSDPATSSRRPSIHEHSVSRKSAAHIDELEVTQSVYNRVGNVFETHSVDIFVNETGAKQINQYIIEAELGRGTSAVVKKVLSLVDHKCYAMKIVDQSKLLAQNSGQWHTVQTEIAIMKKLSHAHIVQLYEVMHDTSTDSLYCVMEYCELGAVFNEDLYEAQYDPLPLPVALKYFRDTILALNYLHCNKVIHRDIKPSNLLLCHTGEVKLADFGVSLAYDATDSLHDTKGSAAFLSPETITRSATAYSGKASDIWSLGVTLHTFVYAQLPFVTDNIAALYDMIVREKLVLPGTPEVPASLRDLLTRMMDKNPATRITMDEILVHDWVTDGGTWIAADHDETMMTDEPVATTITQTDIANAVITVNKLSMMVKLKHKAKRLANQARQSARNSGKFGGEHQPLLSFTDMKMSSSRPLAVDELVGSDVASYKSMQTTNVGSSNDESAYSSNAIYSITDTVSQMHTVG